MGTINHVNLLIFVIKSFYASVTGVTGSFENCALALRRIYRTEGFTELTGRILRSLRTYELWRHPAYIAWMQHSMQSMHSMHSTKLNN